MAVVGICSRCEEEIEEGDFCYRLETRYICETCMHASAVIAGTEIRERESFSLPILQERRMGPFIEREIDIQKYLSSHPLTGIQPGKNNRKNRAI